MLLWTERTCRRGPVARVPEGGQPHIDRAASVLRSISDAGSPPRVAARHWPHFPPISASRRDATLASGRQAVSARRVCAAAHDGDDEDRHGGQKAKQASPLLAAVDAPGKQERRARSQAKEAHQRRGKRAQRRADRAQQTALFCLFTLPCQPCVTRGSEPGPSTRRMSRRRPVEPGCGPLRRAPTGRGPLLAAAVPGWSAAVTPGVRGNDGLFKLARGGEEGAVVGFLGSSSQGDAPAPPPPPRAGEVVRPCGCVLLDNLAETLDYIKRDRVCLFPFSPFSRAPCGLSCRSCPPTAGSSYTRRPMRLRPPRQQR